MEIHSDLPRESCGSDESTLRALHSVVKHLPKAPYIGDFACGPGSSAIPLAQALPDAKILAVDRHPPFIRETQRRADGAGVSKRVEAVVGDMLAPPLEAASFDMIWSEGGIYNVGVEVGLRRWKNYLETGGIVVFNEPVWLTNEIDRPAAVSDFWSAYPAMTDGAGIKEIIESTGYQLLDSFGLPDRDWWDSYYTPIAEKLSAKEDKYKNNPTALLPLKAIRNEIAIRRQFPEHFNYHFYCLTLR